MKKFIALFVLLSLLTTLLVACGGGGGGSASHDVHMNQSNFAQPSITISKGGSINLIDDAAVPHIIENGMWDNGIAKNVEESGAPTVNSLQFNGNDSHSIGPFTTSGAFHLYCTVHENMNLTVTVQ
ncbi:MAG: plastocyanin/azurin family copper-binding protein [Chloroflexota bacterium]|nr:plastocyanin/azurin family copper-binding protein [Chloroflexota bacterium]